MLQSTSHYADTLYDHREDDYGLLGEPRSEDQQEFPRRDRRLPAVLLTMAVMALFAGGLWFAYVQGTKHAPIAAMAQRDGVPLLRADDRPTKVKPEQPGGMKVPDQNVSLYDEKAGGPPVEKLLPQPEQPMPRPAPAPDPPAPQASAEPALAVPNTAPPSAPPATAKPATKAAEPKPAAATGRIEVRLASVRTPDSAREEWARLKRENADLLGSLHANAVPVDLGEKGTYYRIQAGPFADAAAAERLCAELKKRNHGCLLAR
jgi:cell division septation protein DedD